MRHNIPAEEKAFSDSQRGASEKDTPDYGSRDLNLQISDLLTKTGE